MTQSYPPPQGPLPQTDSKAIWALVCSIGGFTVCPIVLSVVGWVLANQSLEAIRASQGTLTGDGIAKTARILSIVGLVLGVLGGLLAITIAVLGFTVWA